GELRLPSFVLQSVDRYSRLLTTMKKIHDKEFAALIGMSAPDRYAVFIRRVADWQEIWGLRSDAGWHLTADENGVEVVPVWPHERFAQACADNHERAAPIPLADWMEKWLPGLQRDGRQVAVFPLPNGKGVVVSPERLKADLSTECAQYE